MKFYMVSIFALLITKSKELDTYLFWFPRYEVLRKRITGQLGVCKNGRTGTKQQNVFFKEFFVNLFANVIFLLF